MVAPASHINDELRDTLGRLEAALSSVDDALALTDFDGLVVWTNRAFDRLTSRTRLATLGQPLDAVLPASYRDQDHNQVARVLGQARNGPGRVCWEIEQPEGPSVMEVKWSPVNVRPNPSIVFVFRDITAVTLAQRMVNRAKENLEREVTVRTEELEQARDDALAANRAMSDFLATISHEIRTPLNAVIGMTDLLLDSDLNDAQQELVQTLQTSGELLLQLINDILDLSKIEARKMLIRSEPYSLRKLVNECAGMMEACVIAKGLKFITNVDPQVPDRLVGDGLRLRQILLNLLSNAIKFTDQGGVTLELFSAITATGDEQMEIIVADTGRGISAEFLPCIFQDFMQETTSVFPTQGTGLGLSICRSLCQLMGGDIKVSSTLGSGSCFQVSLPLKRAEGHRPALRSAPRPVGDDPARPLRILVAEDNRINQRLLELMLAKLNLNAEFVGNGREAVERVAQGGIDVVLMDLQMPEVDGLEGARLIRSGPHQPYIVALTAFALSSHQRECEAAGMNDFLTKPIRLPELQASLERCKGFHQSASA